jgi:serine/threonine-protein kinase RsbW
MGEDSNQSVEVVIANQFEMIDLVQSVLDDLTELVEFDEETVHWMGMAVREALNNAIEHGNKLDPDKQVRITFDLLPETLEIRILDEGAGFDVNSLPDPTEPANLLKPSGRGIFYMRKFMDRVEIRTGKNRGTEVHLVKKRPGAGD